MSFDNIQQRREFFQSQVNALKEDPTDRTLLEKVREAAGEFSATVRTLGEAESFRDLDVKDELIEFTRTVFEAGLNPNIKANLASYGGLAWLDENAELKIVPAPSDEGIAAFKKVYGEPVGKLLPISSVISWPALHTSQITNLTIDVEEDVYFELEFPPAVATKRQSHSTIMVGFGDDVEGVLDGSSSNALIKLESESGSTGNVHNNIEVISGDESIRDLLNGYRNDKLTRKQFSVGVGFNQSEMELTIYVRVSPDKVVEHKTPLDVLSMFFCVMNPTESNQINATAGHIVIRHKKDDLAIFGKGVTPEGLVPLGDINKLTDA